MATACQAIAASGKRCCSRLRPGSTYCFWHDPDRAEQRQALARKGGHNRSNEVRARKHLGEGALTASELHALLCVTLKAVIGGRLEPGVGNAAANLARAITEVGRASEIAERLADLERQQHALRIVS